MTSPLDPAARASDPSPTEAVLAPPIFEPAPQDHAVQATTFEPTPVRAPARPTGKSASTSVLNVALGIAVLVATAGVAFAVGRSTAPVAASSETAIAAAPGGAPFFTNGGPGASLAPNGGPGAIPGNGNGNGPRGFGLGAAPTIQGTVDSMTEDSLTIRTADGNTITIGIDSETTYHQQADATAADLGAGKTVILQLSGGIRPGNGNNGNGNGTVSLGTASDVTVVP